MRIIDVVQGSPEWLNARAGRPTASRFDSIVTPKTRKPSAAADGYLTELVAERILGGPLDTANSIWMDRGEDLEPEARAWYELATGNTVTEVGFCLRDDIDVGGSPDGLVGDDGLVEIKCRKAANHLKAVLDLAPIATETQVQGLMWVTGRKWCDEVAYCPDLPQKIKRTMRDPEWMEVFDNLLPPFLRSLEKLSRRIDRIGIASIYGSELEADIETSIAAMYDLPPELAGSLAEIERALHDGVITEESRDQFIMLVRDKQYKLAQSALEDVRDSVKAVA